MESWQRREKHENDLDNTLRTTGVVKGKTVMKFNGPTFWKKFKELGHTACVFSECECNKR